ncbi:MAG: glycine zipper 2TM domain-containing protein [Erythrobacter sp.]
MQPIRTSLRLATGLAASSAALALAAPAAAQADTLPPLPELPPVAGPSVSTTVSQPETTMPKTTMTEVEIGTLPPEYRSLPVGGELSETTVGADGVETVTRTRRIASSAPPQTTYYDQASAPQAYGQTVYAPQVPAPVAYAPVAQAPVVFEREQWIAECNRRTNGRSESEKGGIIGSLLGAVGGGILGNRIADGERLGGTLIGAGVGGLAGLLLGNLIGGGKKNDRYDCEAALDGYLTQYGKHGARFASRTIAAPVAYAQPVQSYAYAPAPVYYQQQQQMVMVPVYYQQPQRVIVREEVREEVVPGATRYIPPPTPQPAPSPKMIKNR